MPFAPPRAVELKPGCEPPKIRQHSPPQKAIVIREAVIQTVLEQGVLGKNTPILPIPKSNRPDKWQVLPEDPEAINSTDLGSAFYLYMLMICWLSPGKLVKHHQLKWSKICWMLFSGLKDCGGTGSISYFSSSGAFSTCINHGLHHDNRVRTLQTHGLPKYPCGWGLGRVWLEGTFTSWGQPWDCWGFLSVQKLTLHRAQRFFLIVGHRLRPFSD